MLWNSFRFIPQIFVIISDTVKRKTYEEGCGCQITLKFNHDLGEVLGMPPRIMAKKNKIAYKSFKYSYCANFHKSEYQESCRITL